MPGNLSWLAGLGAGLSNLGQNLNTQSLLEKEMQRQKALDALNTLVTLRNVGGTQLPSDVSPQQATQGALVNDLGSAPGLTATAAGMPTFAPAANATNTNPANPLNFGGPRTVQLPGPDGQPINILMDPSKTPEALQEQRMYKQQQLMTDRANQVEQQRVQAAQALEDQRTKAAADAAAATRQAAITAATNKQKGDYATLKAEYGNDPLSKLAFDPNTDYTSALANARAVGMQAKALAATAQGSWTPTQFTDPNTGAPVLLNTKTGETRIGTGLQGKQPGTGGAGGGMQLLAEGRLGFSFNDLKNTIADMTAKENDPAFRAKLTAFTKGQMAAAQTTPNSEAHGMTGVIGNFGGQYLAGKAGENLDPELRQYMLDKMRVGLAFTESMPRPQQQLLHIEQGLSGMDVNWDPGSVAAVQQRRLTGYQVLGSLMRQQGLIDADGNYIMRGSGGAGGGRGGFGGKGGGPGPGATGKATISQAQYDAKRAQGYTDAQIRAAYNVGNP